MRCRLVVSKVNVPLLSRFELLSHSRGGVTQSPPREVAIGKKKENVLPPKALDAEAASVRANQRQLFLVCA